MGMNMTTYKCTGCGLTGGEIVFGDGCPRCNASKITLMITKTSRTSRVGAVSLCEELRYMCPEERADGFLLGRPIYTTIELVDIAILPSRWRKEYKVRVESVQ
jgi:hypothetical protein